ncbi:hypothetical protein HY486_01245 [Candidatus Woesearchaeota archaeon]|nr:hypothetical protein [Candidatus Woesearchaeota archaeon]
MRIEIDTTKDSHEDIQKAIKLLQSITGNNLQENDFQSTQEATNAFTSMFDTNKDQTPIMQNTLQPTEKPPRVEMY